jgi:tryptophan synthase alpha chain
MISLMAHMIPYFPDRQTSREIALTMLEQGVKYLEVQFAFSDPSADGPVIEAACQSALRNGFTVDGGFSFLADLGASSEALAKGRAKLFLMTYASIIFSRGIADFCRKAADVGVSGLIIPDLPLDSDEGLAEAAREAGLDLIPVLAASSRPERIAMARESGANYIYCALRKGITGQETELDSGNIDFLHQAGKSGAKILAGFGISRAGQVHALDGHAEAAVVGTAFLRAFTEGYENRAGVAAVGELAGDLVRAGSEH